MPFIIVTSYYPRGVFVLLNKIGYRGILRKMVCIISKGSRICLSKHSPLHVCNNFCVAIIVTIKNFQLEAILLRSVYDNNRINFRDYTKTSLSIYVKEYKE